jgi:hypothetical protein
MNRIAVSAAVGILAGCALAGAFFWAPYAGMHLTPSMLIVAAASVAFGSSVCITALNLFGKPSDKPTGSKLLSMQLKQADNLLHKFPGRDGALDLIIRPDQKIDQLEVYKNPDNYKDKDITVRLKGSSTKFNPVDLKQLFVSLNQQPGFIHLLLIDKNEEFIGYLPGFAAKRDFTGNNAETHIAKYVVDVFADDSNSANLSLIDGAGKGDIVSDETKVGQLIDKMAGGFPRLVVLKNGYHRRPLGVVNFNDLMVGTLRGAMPASLAPGGALSIGAFR